MYTYFHYIYKYVTGIHINTLCDIIYIYMHICIHTCIIYISIYVRPVYKYTCPACVDKS